MGDLASERLKSLVCAAMLASLDACEAEIAAAFDHRIDRDAPAPRAADAWEHEVVCVDAARAFRALRAAVAHARLAQRDAANLRGQLAALGAAYGSRDQESLS